MAVARTNPTTKENPMTNTEAAIAELSSSERVEIARSLDRLLDKPTRPGWALLLNAVRLDIGNAELREAVALAKLDPDGITGWWPDSDPPDIPPPDNPGGYPDGD